MFVNCTTSDDGAVSCTAFDDCGHGTGVAGVIGAEGNNRIGISGVCWYVSLVSMKVSDDKGEGTTEDLIEAIEYAISQDIDILNISMGNDPTLEDAAAIRYQTLFNTAISNYNGLVVCAAGNTGDNNDDKPEFSLLDESENIIYVGASASNDQKYQTSCFGKKSVDIFAPGYAVLSTMSLDVCPNDSRHDTMFAPHCYLFEENGYHLYKETSFATPFVTGVAALMLSINPNLTATQLKDIILRSVDRVPALQNYCVTGGRLNAYKAVSTASNLRFDYRYTYNSIDAYSHGVICDTCECSCRNPDYSCGSVCDFGCDPCEGCHLYYTELHKLIVSPIIGNIYYHTVRCSECMYSYTQYHEWEATGSQYVCTECNMITDQAPNIIQTLPPVNDEEDLTE